MRVPAAIGCLMTMVVLGVASPTGADVVSGGGGKPAPSPGCDAATVVAPGEEKVTTTSGGAERWYFRHVPPGYDGSAPVPVVLDLHGYSEGAEVHKLHSKLGALGDTEGFVTVTPHGLGPVARWDTGLDSPDVAFIGDLLDEVEETLCVDQRRVFVTGLSNGAFMTSAVACAYADRVAAAAPVAGVRDIEGCDPARRVPVVVFHGTADQFVSFDGGLGPAVASLPNPDGSPREPSQSAPAPAGPSIPDITAAWAERNDCKAKPKEREIASDVTLVSYRCPGNADVDFYRIEGGGHTWPGSEFSDSIDFIVGPTTFSISANDVMWEFFEQHPLPRRGSSK
jgi:polyhydroxybutyrate depolymerase